MSRLLAFALATAVSSAGGSLRPWTVEKEEDKLSADELSLKGALEQITALETAATQARWEMKGNQTLLKLSAGPTADRLRALVEDLDKKHRALVADLEAVRVKIHGIKASLQSERECVAKLEECEDRLDKARARWHTLAADRDVVDSVHDVYSIAYGKMWAAVDEYKKAWYEDALRKKRCGRASRVDEPPDPQEPLACIDDHTGGSCIVFRCYGSRNATCDDNAKCACRKGWCVDAGICYPRPPPPLSPDDAEDHVYALRAAELALLGDLGHGPVGGTAAWLAALALLGAAAAVVAAAWRGRLLGGAGLEERLMG